MLFGAQIDLAALPEISRGALPRHGSLAVFFERPFVEYRPVSRCRVEYFRPEDGALSPATAPSGATSRTVRAMTFERALSLPTWSDRLFRPYYEAMTEDDQARYEALYDLVTPQPFHQLLGHPRLIQGDPRFSCEAEMKGADLQSLMTSDEWRAYIDRNEESRARELLAGWEEWTLLLQLEYDTTLRWLWGDRGNVQLFVREGNVAKGAFLTARMMEQCY